MVKRVFDRRGRSSWDDETKAKEDKRMSERRRADRRSNKKERRSGERRLVDTWVDDPNKENRRAEERRTLQSRRSGKDRRAELTKKPKTYIHELVNTTGGGVQTLPPETLIRDAVSIMAIHKIGLIVVATPEKGLIGVLSERDIIRALHDKGAQILESQVDSYITRGVWTCSPDDHISAIATTMKDNKMRHMPVLKDGALVGIVSATDLLGVVSTT